MLKSSNQKIAFRFITITVTLLLVFLSVLILIIYKIESDNQKTAIINVGDQATKQTAIALENWISDQIKLVQMLARDKRVVNACANPGNAEYVNEASKYLKSVHKLYPYYENLPLSSKMAPGESVEITKNGKTTTVKDGQFFVDTVKGNTIGKCGTHFSYIKAIYEGKDYFISQVYPSILRGNPIFVISAPVKDRNGRLVGVSVIAPQMSYFTNLFVDTVKIGKTGYMFFIDDRGMTLAHPDQKNILNKDAIKNLEPVSSKVFQGKKNFVSSYGGVEKSYIARRINLPEDKLLHKWYMIFCQENSEIMSSSYKFLKILSGICVVFLIIFGIGIFITCRYIIVAPIKKAVESLKDIAQGEGDITKRIDIKSNDEIGEFVGWFNTFLDKLQDIIKNVVNNSHHVDSSSSTLAEIAGKIAQELEKTSLGTNSVSSSVEEMSSSMVNVANAISQSSINVDMVATAAEEMTVTINEIARNTADARTISEQAVSTATNTHDRIAELGKAAEGIGKVVETITDISGNVNLLALNATIEAARAGESGKGFAVVASEVKDLARQTADASLDIKNRIDNIQASTGSSVEGITRITEIINKVDEIIATIATAVEQQSLSTKEIAKNIYQVSEGIKEVNDSINQSTSVAQEISRDIASVNETVEDVSGNSNQVRNNADVLKKMSGELNVLVGSFKI